MGAAVFDGEVLIPEAADDDSGTLYFESGEAFLPDILRRGYGSKDLS